MSTIFENFRLCSEVRTLKKEKFFTKMARSKELFFIFVRKLDTYWDRILVKQRKIAVSSVLIANDVMIRVKYFLALAVTLATSIFDLLMETIASLALASEST